MESRFLDYDPALRRTRIFHSDATGEEYAIESRYDVTDIVDTNRALYAMTDEHARWGEMAHIGSIPTWLLFRLQTEGKLGEDGTVLGEDEELLKWLSDRDHLDFRTRPGRLI